MLLVEDNVFLCCTVTVITHEILMGFLRLVSEPRSDDFESFDYFSIYDVNKFIVITL